MWAGVYEPSLVKFLKDSLKPGMVFFDVGAHIGYFSTIAASIVGEHGAIHAFEAFPENADLCRTNLRPFPWAMVYPSALSDRSGTMPFYGNKNRGEFGWCTLFPAPDADSFGEVPVISLDEWWRTHDLERLDVIKFDIEGGEPRAIQGGLELLRRFKPMICAEVNPCLLKRDGHTIEDVTSPLVSLGYQCRTSGDMLFASAR
jgi:FkbM family methyltransferase